MEGTFQAPIVTDINHKMAVAILPTSMTLLLALLRQCVQISHQS